MRAVITVIGRDMVGIIAKVSSYLGDHKVNIEEITQSVLSDLFAMIMLVDLTDCDIPFTGLSSDLERIGGEMGLKIHAMHEDIFNSMHRI